MVVTLVAQALLTLTVKVLAAVATRLQTVAPSPVSVEVACGGS